MGDSVPFSKRRFVCSAEVVSEGGTRSECGQESDVAVIESTGVRGPCHSEQARSMLAAPLPCDRPMLSTVPIGGEPRVLLGAGAPSVDLARAMSDSGTGSTRRVGLKAVEG